MDSAHYQIKLGEVIRRDRESVNLSRDTVAAKSGFSASTIKNWENGYTAPDLPQMLALYDALEISPQKAIDAVRYQEMDGLSGKDSDEEINAAFDKLMQDLSILEKRQLLFMRSDYHGGDWLALLQMVTAHLHTPFASRYAVAQMIAIHYKLSEATNSIMCPDNVRPDMDLLEKAIDAGRDAAFSGATSYILNGKDFR